MITVKNLFGQTVTIDENLKVSGNTDLKAAIDVELAGIDIESTPVNPLAFVFYDLQGKGYDVTAPDSDLEPVELPPDAVG